MICKLLFYDCNVSVNKDFTYVHYVHDSCLIEECKKPLRNIDQIETHGGWSGRGGEGDPSLEI